MQFRNYLSEKTRALQSKSRKDVAGLFCEIDSDMNGKRSMTHVKPIKDLLAEM